LAWYGKKLNLKQQKHEFNNQKKYTTTQNKHNKTKAMFSLLFTTSGLEMEWVYSQKKKEISKENVKKKG